METKCIICNGKAAIAYKGLFDDRYGYPKAFDAYRCRTCRSFSMEPRLEMSEVGPLYTGYYPRNDLDPLVVEARAGSFKLGGSDRESGQHRAQRLLPQARRSGLTVLDVGCGDGSSLLELKVLGYDAYGIETDANVARIRDALGLNIHIGTIEDAPFQGRSFDYILANQVIEHVVDIEGFCSSIEKQLAPGGTAIFSTPNARSIFRAIYGRRWIHWHIPYHQQIFSAKGLSKILARNGLKAVRTQTVDPASWTMHELNRLRFKAELGKKNPFWTDPASVRSTLAGKIARKLAFYAMQTLGEAARLSGRGDCLIVWAKDQNAPDEAALEAAR